MCNKTYICFNGFSSPKTMKSLTTMPKSNDQRFQNEPSFAFASISLLEGRQAFGDKQ